MSNSKKIILTPDTLRACTIIERNFVFEREKEKILLRGYISDENNRPIQEVVVVIFRKDNCTECCEELGYTFTDAFGQFVALVDKSCRYDYYVEIYSPLKK